MDKVQIKDVATIVNGSTPSTKKPEYWDGDIPWITPKDLSSNHMRFVSRGERNITDEGYKSCSTTLLPKDTVLLTSRAPIGYLAIASCPMCTNQGFKSLICNQDKILPLYIYYWLSTRVNYLKGISTGATFKELSKSTLENVEIELPTISEQQHIVGVIGSVDDLIENKQAALSLLDNIIDQEYARLVVENGFSTKKLSSLVAAEVKGDWGSDADRAGMIACGVLRGTDIASLSSHSEANIPTRYLKSKGLDLKALKDNDIAIEMSGGGPKQPTGRTYLVDTTIFEKTLAVSNFCRGLRCGNELDSFLLYAALRDLYTKHVTGSYELGTTGIKNLNLHKLLEEYYVPSGTKSELEKFREKCQAAKLCQSAITKEVAVLKRQKSLLLTKYFS